MTVTDIQRRYGGDADQPVLSTAEGNEVIRTQLEHRSVRAFADRDVDPATLGTILAAAQSAPTSSNLQSWSVVVLRDADRRGAAARLAGQQDWICAAPVFLVWVVDFARVRLIAADRGVSVAATDFLEAGALGLIDVALAAQNASLAAESLGLGTGFVGAVRDHPEEMAELLQLPSGSFAPFGLAIGYPDPERPAEVKPRLPSRAVVHEETYRYDAAAVEEYEQRIGAFYASQGLSHSWTERILGRLADADSLKGRDRLRQALLARGLRLE